MVKLGIKKCNDVELGQKRHWIGHTWPLRSRITFQPALHVVNWLKPTAQSRNILEVHERNSEHIYAIFKTTIFLSTFAKLGDLSLLSQFTMKTSLLQHFFSHQTRSTLTISQRLRKSSHKNHEANYAEGNDKSLRQKECNDQHIKPLPSLQDGSSVRKEKPWINAWQGVWISIR